MVAVNDRVPPGPLVAFFGFTSILKGAPAEIDAELAPEAV